MGLFDFLKNVGETDAQAARRLYDSATRQYETKNYADAVRLYEAAWGKCPDVDTFFPLSVCYYSGWGTARDERRCYELTRHAAMKDVPGAMSNLSFFLNTGYGCDVDRTEARAWLERSAATGFLDARYTLALCQHTESRDNPPLLHQCYLNMKACADRGHKDSQRLMAEWFGPVTDGEWQGLTVAGMANRGYAWMNGTDGFDKNPTLAMRCLRAAAGRGSAAAWCNIGWMLDNEGSHAEANEAYLKGANLGNTTAMLNLARNLHIGRGWPRDDAGARYYLTMAHESGDKRGMERMAEFFPEDEVRRQSEGMTAEEINNRAWALMKGFDGLERDAAKAALWFGVAAAKGVAAAWFGKGTALDELGRYAEAFAAYMNGAGEGNANCMYIVGTRYAEGTGCRRDDDKAMEWLLKADDAGDPRAADKLFDLYPELLQGDEGYDADEDGDGYDGDDEEVRFMLDNMSDCLYEDFSSDEYDVEDKARRLIYDEDWATARLLLEKCLETARFNDFDFSYGDDIKSLLAWVYYNDGDGTDGTDSHGVEKDTDWYRTRLAHSLVADIPSDFESCNDCDGETEMFLASIYYNCFCLYDDFGISGLPGSHPQSWYGKRAYDNYGKAASCGFYFAMYRQAQFLLAGDVVPRDYGRARALYNQCKNHIDTSVYRLGEEF